LGRLDSGNFLGGKRCLDHIGVMDFLHRQSEELDMDPLDLADGIIKIANSTMQRALVRISVQRGYDPRDFTLVSFGGAGGLHACELARELGIKRVLIPQDPGVLSAYGMLLTDVIKNYSRSYLRPSEETDHHGIEDAFLPLERAAMAELVKEKFDLERIVLARSVDMRYRRQSFELNVPFSKTYVANFHQLHLQRYGHCDVNEKVEVVNLRLEGRGITDKNLEFVPDIKNNENEDAVIKDTVIYHNGRESDAIIYNRKNLSSGDTFNGPALITEYTSTTFVPPGFSVRVNAHGGLEICLK